ncbi:unnamed protein product, partial [Mesorhabditis spiculigera]
MLCETRRTGYANHSRILEFEEPPQPNTSNTRKRRLSGEESSRQVKKSRFGFRFLDAVRSFSSTVANVLGLAKAGPALEPTRFNSCDERIDSMVVPAIITLDDSDIEEVPIVSQDLRRSPSLEVVKHVTPDVIVVKSPPKKQISEVQILHETVTLDNEDDVQVIERRGLNTRPRHIAENAVTRNPQPPQIASTKNHPNSDEESLERYKRLFLSRTRSYSDPRALNALSGFAVLEQAGRSFGGQESFGKSDVSERSSTTPRTISGRSSSLSRRSEARTVTSPRTPTTSFTSPKSPTTDSPFAALDGRLAQLNLGHKSKDLRIREYQAQGESQKAYLRRQEDEVQVIGSARAAKRPEYTLDKIKKKVELYGIVIPVPEPKKDPFPKLPDDHNELLQRAWNQRLNPNEVFSTIDSVPIHRKDLLTLRPRTWLNDEVICAFLNLIVDRGCTNGFPSVYTFNTFFYSNLRTPGKGYPSVARWTRKVDVFEKDILLVPVHLEVHWCMATINVRAKKIEYFDSMGGYRAGAECLEHLLKYLEKEADNKNKPPGTFVRSEWEAIFRENIPQQRNGYDCGVFASQFAEAASRHAPIQFRQENIDYFRERMVWELVNQKLYSGN